MQLHTRFRKVYTYLLSLGVSSKGFKFVITNKDSGNELPEPGDGSLRNVCLLETAQKTSEEQTNKEEISMVCFAREKMLHITEKKGKEYIPSPAPRPASIHKHRRCT